MNRRYLATVALAVTAGAASMSVSTPIAAAAPGSAGSAGSCTLSAPARVSITSPYQEYTLKGVGSCTKPGGTGYWKLVHPYLGEIDYAEFDGSATETWPVYDFFDTGLHTWRPDGAFNSENASLTQNSTKTDIRYGGSAKLATSRSGNVVTLTGTARRYHPMTESMIHRADALGQFQYREKGSNTWNALKEVKTGRNGTVSLSYRISKTREYRYATYSTTSLWNQTSAAALR